MAAGKKHHCGLTRTVSFQKESGYKQAARKTNSARGTLLFTVRGSLPPCASRTRHEKIAATNKQASRSLVKKNFAPPLPLATGQNWKLAASNSQLATGNWQQETAPRALNHLPRGQEGLAHRAGRRASSGESSLAQRGGVPLADALWKRQALLVKAARLCHSRSKLPKAPVVALLIRAARLPFPKPPAARLG